ncbi:unnamed protein product, partial [Ceratitis capitata]
VLKSRIKSFKHYIPKVRGIDLGQANFTNISPLPLAQGGSCYCMCAFITKCIGV